MTGLTRSVGWQIEAQKSHQKKWSSSSNICRNTSRPATVHRRSRSSLISRTTLMIYTFGERKLETAGADFYVAPGAQLIGSVRLGRGASVWFNCVLRGDNEWIVVGDGSN